MSDEEWERWKDSYTREARPIPTVLKRARTDRARALFAMAAMYVIVLALVAEAIVELGQAHTVRAAVSPLLQIGLLAILVTSVHVAMRGTFRRRSGAPLALLEELERRHAGRRHLIRFLPWLVGFAVAGAIADVVASMVAERRFDLTTALAALAVCAFTIWFARAVSRRVSRLIDRELREAAEVRRLLEAQ